MKTALVIGAGGFIGLNVVKEYASYGWHILALVHRNIPEELAHIYNVEIIKGDVTDENFMLQFYQGVDVVCYVAGLAKDAWIYLYNLIKFV